MMTYDRLVTGCYGASLVTLPWVGLGTLHLLTGRDWGGGLQLSWVFMALAVLLSLVRNFVFSAQRNSIPFSLLWQNVTLRLSFFILAMILVSGAGIWFAPPPVTVEQAVGRFFKQVVQLLIMLTFTVWVIKWTNCRQRWLWTARMVVLGALIQVGYGIMQLAVYGHHWPWFSQIDAIFTSNPAILSGSQDLYLNNAMQNIPRLRGMVCEPLYLGNYLLLALPLVALTDWPRSVRWLVGILLGGLLFMTWSRGAWLAVVVALMAGGWVWARQRMKGRVFNLRRAFSTKKILVLGMVPLLILVAARFGVWDLPGRRLEQSFSTRDWSNLTRVYSMQAAWRAFLLSPIVGIGWGQFGWHFPVLVNPLGLQSQFTWPVVNNFFLKILCETGLLGFFATASVLGRAVVGFWRESGTEGPASAWRGRRAIVVAVVFVGVWVQLLTFSQYNLPHIWVALGLFIAISRPNEASPPQEIVN